MSKLFEVNGTPIRVEQNTNYHDITLYGYNGSVTLSFWQRDNHKKGIKEIRKLIKELEQAIEFLEEE